MKQATLELLSLYERLCLSPETFGIELNRVGQPQTLGRLVV